MHEYEQAVRSLVPVTKEHRNLETSMVPSATPLARQIVYGVLRNYYRLDDRLGFLLDKPLPPKHTDIRMLLLCGLYSIEALNRPGHASVNACVEAASSLGKAWAKGLANAILRKSIRLKPQLDARANKSIEAKYNHPRWLVDRIMAAWPGFAEDILEANNSHPPLVLRVNLSRVTREEYLSLLEVHGMRGVPGPLCRSAVQLDEPCGIEQLPGFREGLVSVQDESSQLAAGLLDVQPGHRVLDTCAAPGGKTCHLLEMYPDSRIVANDIAEHRLEAVLDNLRRLALSCELTSEDLRNYSSGDFDRILLDAPCSATGIIRRHPDIKLLRRNTDIAKLAEVQYELVDASWGLLKPGGEILYSTCSILPEENEEVIGRFVSQHQEARVLSVEASGGVTLDMGYQLLPSTGSHDGFYYARLQKSGSGSSVK